MLDKISQQIRFVKTTIQFNDETIIDLSNVSKQASAMLFSASTTDFGGIKTTFSIHDSQIPFSIAAMPFSVSGFIRAVVENRIEIEGMIITPRIMDAYDFVTNRKTLLLPGERQNLQKAA